MKTTIKILDQEQLSDTQKAEMWRIYKGFYFYSEEYFMQRLNRNTHFALYSYKGRIVGFTGLRINKIRINGRRNLLFYFGQTVITRAHRGKSLIPITALMLTLKFWSDFLISDTWYWYDALSYKAYLVSAKIAENYYPAYNKVTPENVEQMRNFAGTRWYGSDYCPTSGTVSKPVNYLNDVTVKICPEDMQDPDIAFFAKANPNHALGHGLLTFIPVNTHLLWILAGRFFIRLLKGGKQAKRKPAAIRKPQPAFVTVKD